MANPFANHQPIHGGSSQRFIPYPDLEDPDFYEKIYKKKEFYDTKPPPLPSPDDQTPETLDKIFRLDGDFRLLPQQRFLRNYISEATPYGGILMFHSTGTGKTCAAISIAERFRNRVEDTGKRILVVVGRNIQDEFRRTIFNFDKEAAKLGPRQIVQCTGRTYQLGAEARHLSDKQRRKVIEKAIRNNYDFAGHLQLVNQAKHAAHWNGQEESITPEVRARLAEHYSDRVIVVDEVHHGVGTEGEEEKFPFVLQTIVESAKNIRLVLMTATPMVNSPKDILLPINLLRINDGREPVRARDIFRQDGTLLPDGEKKLMEAVKGYISYVRGDDPPRFPYKLQAPEAKTPHPIYQISGEKIPKKDLMKTTRLILCPGSQYQFKTYEHILNKEKQTDIGGLFQGSTQSSNIVFPSKGKIGLYGSEGYGARQSEEYPLIESKDARGNIIYSYAPYAAGFLLSKNIEKYSSKFKQIYERIANATGLAYVYSDFLPGGVLSLALMLEENGFSPALITGVEHPLLRSKTKKPPICYMCGKERHSPSVGHVWAPARYVLLTGSQELGRTEAAKISGYLNRKENMYGRLVKVLLGTKVSGEGIDFKRIRQVHIMEPWFNQARIQQVEGRAIRNGSHIDLPPDQRNVTIFKYCFTPPKKLKNKISETETVDERNYRLSEDKYRKILVVARLLKMAAVDCLFERANNIRKVHRTIRQEDSLGRIVNFKTGDIPCSAACDFMRNCDYECVWRPKRKHVELDRSTYGPEFAQADIERARERIQELFKFNNVVDAHEIFKYIKEKEPDVDNVYTFMALETLMDPEGEYAVQDRYGREGFLLERGDLYIYQPFDIMDTDAPLYYRVTPLETKPVDAAFPVSEIENVTETVRRRKIPDKSGLEVFKERRKKYKAAVKALEIYMKPGEKRYNTEILAMVLDTLPDIWALALIRYLLNPFYETPEDDNAKQTEELRLQILTYYKDGGHILVQGTKKKQPERRAIMIGERCAQWGRAEHGIKRKLRKAWGKCDPDVESYLESSIKDAEEDAMWKKIPQSKRPRPGEVIGRSDFLHMLKQLGLVSSYAGTVESTGSDQAGFKYFKILDFTKEESVKRKDKSRSRRSEIRGRVCSTIEVENLVVVLNAVEKAARSAKLPKLTVSTETAKKASRAHIRSNVCTRIEFLLRALNKETNKIWFYKGTFAGEGE